MKHRRKIWFAPIAVLALVLMLAAVVFAAVPEEGTQIPDQTILIGANLGESGTVADPNTNVEIDLTDVDGPTVDGNDDANNTNEAAFTDEDVNDTLAYTAMTSDTDIARVSGLDELSTVAVLWWDALGDRAARGTTVAALDNADCTQKAMRLGFSLTANTNTEDEPDRPDNAPATSALVGAEGLCGNFTTDLSGEAVHAVTDDLAEVGAQAAVVAAFHWDMLSGAEMIVAANAAGEPNPSGYGTHFGGLSQAEKLEVFSWFAEDNILARGEGGNLIVDHDGIDGIDDDTSPEGKAGSATITVKVSDAEGRLIPPGNGSATVGQTFTGNRDTYDDGRHRRVR